MPFNRLHGTSKPPDDQYAASYPGKRAIGHIQQPRRASMSREATANPLVEAAVVAAGVVIGAIKSPQPTALTDADDTMDSSQVALQTASLPAKRLRPAGVHSCLSPWFSPGGAHQSTSQGVHRPL